MVELPNLHILSYKGVVEWKVCRIWALTSKNLTGKIEDILSISERLVVIVIIIIMKLNQRLVVFIIIIIIKPNQRLNLKKNKVYAPTSVYNGNEQIKFYEDVK